ncbi:M91 family zinc metallopeptidase [Xenorhabdus santafensis]|nr:M91 family zinc metallopeptidase [Xenorhabdus sp. 12]
MSQNLSPLPTLEQPNLTLGPVIQHLIRCSSVGFFRHNKQLSFVGHDKANYQLVAQAFKKIESTHSGARLLESIRYISRLKSKNIVIHLDYDKNPYVKPNYFDDAHNRRGTGSEFHCYLPSLKPIYDSNYSNDMTLEQFYACIVYHELLHVFHNLKGNRLVVMPSDPHSSASSNVLLEEARTVGLGSFSDEEFSENKFRKEIKVPLRTSYQSSDTLIHDDNTGSKSFDSSPEELHPLLPHQTPKL